MNEKGSFILRDKKLIAYNTGKKRDNFLVKENKDGTHLKYGGKIWDSVTKRNLLKLYQIKGYAYIDSAVIKERNADNYFMPSLNDGKFYLFDGLNGKCFIYSDFDTHPIHFNIDSISAPEAFNNFEFTPTGFYLLGLSGKIYLYNKKNLQLEAVVNGNYLPNSMYKDSKGNLWICTIDKGLLVYKKRKFRTVEMPNGFTNTNFLSIARKKDGTLLAGNFYGEVMEAFQKAVTIKSIPKESKIIRQRKILFSQNKIFTFSEAGIYVNYTRQLKMPVTNTPISGKAAIMYNDSIILVSQSTNFHKLNAVTEKTTRLHALGKRITALTSDADGMVYFGSTDGLYKYIYTKDTSLPLVQNNPLLRERITALCTSPDKLLWVATSGSGVVVVKDDKVLLHISEKEGIVNNASRSITAGKPGQIWLGTAGGISVINYALQNTNILYTIQNLSVNDGLTNNVINEMVYQHDTIYAATGDGISIIPANISIPKFNIPIESYPFDSH